MNSFLPSTCIIYFLFFSKFVTSLFFLSPKGSGWCLIFRGNVEQHISTSFCSYFKSRQQSCPSLFFRWRYVNLTSCIFWGTLTSEYDSPNSESGSWVLHDPPILFESHSRHEIWIWFSKFFFVLTSNIYWNHWYPERLISR